MYRILILVFAIFFLASCSKNKINKSEEKSTMNYDVTRALNEYESKLVDFETFEAKVKCRYEDKDKNLSFKTTIRILKDEKIWISAGMFGFEGVRALITPDSIKVINKLQGKYYEESINELQTLSGLPVDFSMLQSLITGKLLMVNPDNSNITQKDGVYELISEQDQITSLALLNDANFQLIRQDLIEQAKERHMELKYHNYQPLGGADFPYESDVHVTGEKDLWLDLSFSNVELNKNLDFPFTISKSYSRAHL